MKRFGLISKSLYRPAGARAFYIARVSCPHCLAEHTVAFAGWSALTCVSCGEAAARPASRANGDDTKAAAPTT